MLTRFAASVLVIVLLVLGIRALADTQPTVDCGGPQVSTPLVLHSINAGAKTGDIWHDLITDGANPWEVYRAVKAAGDTLGRALGVLGLGQRAIRSHMDGSPEDTAVTGWRNRTAESQAALLAGCCVQQTPPPPQDETNPPEAGEPFDPKQASLQTSDPRMPLVQVAVDQAAEHRLPTQAAVIAVAAGLVESGMRNLDHGDRDSLGVLQQRPSQGWGTPTQVQTPTYAFGKFYDALAAVPGWQNMPPGAAAQAVQRSAFPDRYAGRLGEARRLVAAAGEPVAAPPPISDPLQAAACAAAAVAPPAPGEPASPTTPGEFNFTGQRTVDQAVAWMAHQRDINSDIWARKCLRDVGLAYGHDGTARTANFWAIEHYRATPQQYRLPVDGTPPRGALVYWDTGGPGHVALSNGDGRVWTNDAPGRYGMISLVPIRIIDGWGRRVGVTAPFFPQKTPSQA